MKSFLVAVGGIVFLLVAEVVGAFFFGFYMEGPVRIGERLKKDVCSEMKLLGALCLRWCFI